MIPPGLIPPDEPGEPAFSRENVVEISGRGYSRRVTEPVVDAADVTWPASSLSGVEWFGFAEARPGLSYTARTMIAILALQFVSGLLIGFALGWWLS